MKPYTYILVYLWTVSGGTQSDSAFGGKEGDAMRRKL